MMNVLIADDNRFLRKSLVQIVGSLHVKAVTDEAADGMEAMFKIKSNHYDLVILDLSMPKMDGMKILKQMKKLGIDSKVIIFSLSVDEKVPRQALALGADAVVTKSASYAEIKNTIETIAMQM